MAIINYTDQLKYAGKGYLDAKMMPVASVDDLKKIALTQRFEGLTITVLNDGNPQDYWLIGGISNSNWVPKTATSFDDLHLVLEEGFLKLMNNDSQLGGAIDLNEFFPGGEPSTGEDMFILSVDYASSNDMNQKGIFMCFTYSNGTKKYLDMSQFLSTVYEGGDGIVINGSVISLDEAVLERIETLETNVEAVNTRLEEVETKNEQVNTRLESVETEVSEVKGKITEYDAKISEVETGLEQVNVALETKAEAAAVQNLSQQLLEEIDARIAGDNSINEILNALTSDLEGIKQNVVEVNTALTEVDNKVSEMSTKVDNNTEKANANAVDIATLTERVNSLSAAAEGSTPDGKTIGITDDESKSLYVKILNKEGNMLVQDTNEDGESGLYVNIPIFCEDEDLN